MRLSALSCVALMACAHTPEPVAPPPPETAPEVTVSLRILDGGVNEQDMPRSNLALAVIEAEGSRDVTPIGTYLGVCSHETARPPDLLRANCWWAGAGHHIFMRRQNDRLIVRVAEVDEETGEGEAQSVLEVGLPTGAELRLVTALD